MEFDVLGLVGWLPEGLSDLINCVSRSALARILFRGLHPDLWISPASKRDSIKIYHSLGDAFFSTNTPPLNDELCQFSPPTRPGENTGSSQALTHLNGIYISFVKGESPWNWTVTLLLHYGEVHSRHGRSTSYRRAIQAIEEPAQATEDDENYRPQLEPSKITATALWDAKKLRHPSLVASPFFIEIGAGAATISLAGAVIGIGNVLSSSIHSMARNPSLAKQSFGYAILGFALTEAIASFAPMMAFLISSVFRSKKQRKK
nr:ATPase subunit 9, mitochondrial [Tanacetum cinerariifolium]